MGLAYRWRTSWSRALASILHAGGSFGKLLLQQRRRLGCSSSECRWLTPAIYTSLAYEHKCLPSPSHTGLTLLSALAPSSPPREDQACPRAAGALQTARRLRAVGPTFFRLDYSGYQGCVLLDLTELSSYLPLVPCFEFGNASGTLFPCTEGRVRTIMVPPETPRAGAFKQKQARKQPKSACERGTARR